ncbi:hypothetical protein [Rhizobium ruizarguesonis]|uniref:hypothetical protein n=1 Tax=Rhizobium ruizarguesonis TaxID=2081791 RepID=UPI0010322F8D|nr:hypothetical protein [Rhizobium ruizarguesonis]TCB02986.1 hypothetical protein E0H65_04505 [Rhizobium leguminosarum bv. viciae]TBD31929.1 hypothetical protein ELH19_29690 [Rhizobium ruizarguesonis]TBD33089.1 hypothetical protein ELH18_27495 [Rhizobium ruizarguesonis]TBD51957.1 hypothetical protein ELH15_31600 [Rhizobium ruizarguesonis]TBD75361.1 hypothetical protein ELH14_30745 [Rhizobium ruizarguesonis]
MRKSTEPTENFAPRFGRLGARIAKAKQIKIARPKCGPSNKLMISIAPFREDATDPIVHVPRADLQICFVGRRCACANMGSTPMAAFTLHPKAALTID